MNVVTPTFKDYKNGKFKIISFYAKKARGMMARWIIENKITDFEKLSGFNVDESTNCLKHNAGLRFANNLSSFLSLRRALSGFLLNSR